MKICAFGRLATQVVGAALFSGHARCGRFVLCNAEKEVYQNAYLQAESMCCRSEELTKVEASPALCSHALQLLSHSRQSSECAAGSVTESSAAVQCETDVLVPDLADTLIPDLALADAVVAASEAAHGAELAAQMLRSALALYDISLAVRT
jgi:hypothetical protein